MLRIDTSTFDAAFERIVADQLDTVAGGDNMVQKFYGTWFNNDIAVDGAVVGAYVGATVAKVPGAIVGAGVGAWLGHKGDKAYDSYLAGQGRQRE